MLSPDDTLRNRYKIIQAIKKGGMGQIYMAEDIRLRCFVAIKEAHDNDCPAREAFEREARLLANLDHPALPKVSNIFEEGNTHYIVMEYVDGKDFSELLATRKLRITEVLDCADQVLDVLELLHGNSSPIIHRDIKPLNLKRTPRGRVKLLDFGLAKGAAGQMTTSQADQSIRGWTQAYAPPEQINDYGTDERSDIYSLSATLFHLLTGELPPDAVLRATASVTGNPDPLRQANELNGAVPVQIADIIHQGLALDPARRIPNATMMRRMLRDAAAENGLKIRGGSDSDSGALSQEEEPTRRRPAAEDADLPTTVRDADIS